MRVDYINKKELVKQSLDFLIFAQLPVVASFGCAGVEVTLQLYKHLMLKRLNIRSPKAL